MEEKLRNLRQTMDDTVFSGTYFTEQQKRNIRAAARKPIKSGDWFPKFLTVMVSTCFLLFIGNLGLDAWQERYGSNSAETQNWEVSHVFSVPKPGPDGKDMQYSLWGVKGKWAILDGPVLAGEKNKELVHIWGASHEETVQGFGKMVKIIGTSKQDGTKVTAFEGSIGIPSSYYVKPPYEYAEAVGYLILPSKGIWKLDCYVEDKFHGTIVIEVQ
ncbi:hypothetical protein [Neobacillus mesonae]|uniref:hypothetical protein n=1 Tax=Neobacillus mesonae TaxID=1193713 RepID=UPI002572964A|nr:hypothetical protein [Neobacillus mesonae]MED4206490.1 hypothetical protein [Neobacillus mesonae]